MLPTGMTKKKRPFKKKAAKKRPKILNTQYGQSLQAVLPTGMTNGYEHTHVYSVCLSIRKRHKL